MPLRVTCPSCQASLKLDEKLAGRNLVCPSCRSGFRVAANGGNASDGPRANGDDSDLSESQLPPRLNVSEPELDGAPIKKYKRRRNKKKKRGRLDRAPLAVRGFALLLVGGLAASFVYLRPQGSETASVSSASVTTGPQNGSDQPAESAEGTSQSARGSRAARPVTAQSPSPEFQNADPNDRFQIIWAPRHSSQSAGAQ